MGKILVVVHSYTGASDIWRRLLDSWLRQLPAAVVTLPAAWWAQTA